MKNALIGAMFTTIILVGIYLILPSTSPSPSSPLTVSSSTPFAAVDILSFSQDIAQLNLGYLTIVVGILGILGGVFVYFNLVPIKESLNKQEQLIESIRREANDLLSDSRSFTEAELAFFEKSQAELLAKELVQQNERVSLEVQNKIQESERTVSEKAEKVSEDKDLKLREILESQTKNQLTTLETSLLKKIRAAEEKILYFDENIKELQAIRYHSEGKMGAITYSTQLLRDAIDLYEESSAWSWKVTLRLEELLKKCKEYLVRDGYARDLETQLSRIRNKPEFSKVIQEIDTELSTKDR